MLTKVLQVLVLSSIEFPFKHYTSLLGLLSPAFLFELCLSECLNSICLLICWFGRLVEWGLLFWCIVPLVDQNIDV